MFIELAEFLRCPAQHEARSYCVVLPEEMSGRRIRRGSIGCPECGREFAIVEGIARFGERDGVATPVIQEAESDADPSALAALLGLAGPGGYVVLVGAVARLAEQLAGEIEGVHFVGVNAPPEVRPSEALSLVAAPDGIPLASAMARGCVVSRGWAREPWLAEAARVVLRGLRLVVLAENVTAAGVEQLAAGDGMWVGVKQ